MLNMNTNKITASGNVGIFYWALAKKILADYLYSAFVLRQQQTKFSVCAF